MVKCHGLAFRAAANFGTGAERIAKKCCN